MKLWPCGKNDKFLTYVCSLDKSEIIMSILMIRGDREKRNVLQYTG